LFPLLIKWFSRDISKKEISTQRWTFSHVTKLTKLVKICSTKNFSEILFRKSLSITGTNHEKSDNKIWVEFHRFKHTNPTIIFLSKFFLSHCISNYEIFNPFLFHVKKIFQKNPVIFIRILLINLKFSSDCSLNFSSGCSIQNSNCFESFFLCMKQEDLLFECIMRKFFLSVPRFPKC